MGTRSMGLFDKNGSGALKLVNELLTHETDHPLIRCR
jgi:hypothetical protein